MNVTREEKMRVWLGQLLIRMGMAILPKDVRQMAIDLIMYHVPGALSEDRKAEIRAAKTAAYRTRQ